MTGSFAADQVGPLSNLSYRERDRSPPPGMPDWANLYGIKHSGRWVLLYSRYDINCGVTGHNCPTCVGYRPAGAETIATNILLYAATEQVMRDSGEQAGKNVEKPEAATQPNVPLEPDGAVLDK